MLKEPNTLWVLAVYEHYRTLKYCPRHYYALSTSSPFNEMYVLLHSPRTTRWLCAVPYGCFSFSEETLVNWGDNTGSMRVFDTDCIANTFSLYGPVVVRFYNVVPQTIKITTSNYHIKIESCDTIVCLFMVRSIGKTFGYRKKYTTGLSLELCWSSCSHEI